MKITMSNFKDTTMKCDLDCNGKVIKLVLKTHIMLRIGKHAMISCSSTTFKNMGYLSLNCSAMKNSNLTLNLNAFQN